MLAWMSVPIVTAARPKSAAPIWRRASTSVASAWTTWVRSTAQAWTTLGEASTPSTSLPRRVSVVGEGAAEAAEADHEGLVVVASQRSAFPPGG